MMRDEQQRAWRESWAGWDVTPPGVPSENGYNAMHEEYGGFGRLSTPSPEWAEGGVPHRFWEPEEVQAEADAWGARWDDRWADDEGSGW